MNVEGKIVALRTDLNLPLKNGVPQKTLRFERYLETIKELSERNAKTVILSHQGRPGRDDFISLENHFNLLNNEINPQVHFISSILGNELEKTIDEMNKGEVALLENIRMMSEELKNYSGEKHSQDVYIEEISENFDLYMNDGFSVAHRSHASIVGLPKLLNSVPGPIMEEELKNCRKIRDEFDSGVLVLGGEKPSDLIGIIESKIDSVDKVLLGGVPGEVALLAQGKDLGKKTNWIEQRDLDSKKMELKNLIESYPEKFEIPIDLSTENGDKKPEDIQGMTWDIGSQTAKRYAEIIQDAESVAMKGPMGAFEKYSEGTEMVLDALKRNDGFTVMGGGHTSSLVRKFGYSIDDFDHVSIAGGAFVRCVSGEKLPGVEALDI